LTEKHHALVIGAAALGWLSFKDEHSTERRIELKLFRFAESAGKARWRAVDLGTLATSLHFTEHAVLIDALHDLHERAFLELRQWSYALNDWVIYDGQAREYFSHDFQMRVTFSGRKYFERLEAQGTDPNPSVPMRETQLQGATAGKATVQARLDSSPQRIATPVPTNPNAFVSHSGKDRQFVEKLVADLWAVGVKAWYSKWEIKPGDSIPGKIDEGIEECEFFLIVLSRNSINAPWVQTELQAATVRKLSGKVRKIIPITVDDCDDFPPIIDSLCREDFANQPYESALKRVLDSIFDVDVRPQLGHKSC
jgi:hypothetical protein